jgi:hypothetical protein
VDEIRFERIDDDGRFSVLRVTIPALTTEPLVLRVATDSAEHGFVQVDPGLDEDDDYADFLLPSRLVAGSAFALDVEGRLLRMPDPVEQPAYRAAPGAMVEFAHLAQQEQLAEQLRRIAKLRAELHEVRDRELGADEALVEEVARLSRRLAELGDDGGVPAAEPAPDGGSAETPRPRPQPQPGEQSARIVALNMAIRGTPREETARCLAEKFDLEDHEALLDEVYGSAG